MTRSDSNYYIDDEDHHNQATTAIATVGRYGGGTTVGVCRRDGAKLGGMQRWPGCFTKRKIHYILLLQIIK
jgi:hypothetical protein